MPRHPPCTFPQNGFPSPVESYCCPIVSISRDLTHFSRCAWPSHVYSNALELYRASRSFRFSCCFRIVLICVASSLHPGLQDKLEQPFRTFPATSRRALAAALSPLVAPRAWSSSHFERSAAPKQARAAFSSVWFLIFLGHGMGSPSRGSGWPKAGGGSTPPAAVAALSVG